MCYGKRLLSHCDFPDNTDYYFRILYPIDGGLATLLHLTGRNHFYLKKSGVVVREYPQNSVCGMGLFRLRGAMVLPLCEICQKLPIIYMKIVKSVVHSNEKYVIILISNLIFR